MHWTELLIARAAKEKKLRLMMIEYLFSVVAIQVSIDSYVALVMTW